MHFTSEEQDAIKLELDNLKAHAHHDELKNLNVHTFDPTLPHGCIYGQLSGECHSTRAKHLLEKCAVPFSAKIDERVTPTEDGFHGRKLFVVGHHDTYSILEVAVFCNREIIPKVIAYLKSENDHLIFE